MIPVKSSNIAEIGHDPSTNTMRVKFHGGATYEYSGVSAEKHQALIGAQSIGSHFTRHIRPHHEFRKVA